MTKIHKTTLNLKIILHKRILGDLIMIFKEKNDHVSRSKKRQ